jgi:cation transport ATPase
MLNGSVSGCINHPGIEAVARCKQCGKPVCGACMVSGPTGRFCSDACKEKHERFIRRAQELEKTRPRTGNLAKKLRRLIVKLVILVAVLLVLGWVAVYFDIPVVGAVARRVLIPVSRFLPFLH